MKNFVRDSAVFISLTFTDANSVPITPGGANITVSYVPLGVSCERTFLTYPMLPNPAPGAVDWIYTWDSSVAEPGVVHCHAQTTTPGVAVSSVDFEFRITGNNANRMLAGDDLGSDYGYGYGWR